MRVLITGSAKRIGKVMAMTLAAAGHSIVLHYNQSEEDAKNTLLSLPAPAASLPAHSCIQADLTNAAQREALLESALADGSLDALINNASVYTRHSLADESIKGFENAFTINAFAPIALMQLFQARCHRGCIINMLDCRVAQPDPASGAYGLAKKTLRDATLAAAMEWAPDIRVNAIAPGLVRPADGVALEKTVQLAQSTLLQCRPTEDDIARAALFLLTTPSITGQIIYIDAGMHLQAPSSIHEKAPHVALSE